MINTDRKLDYHDPEWVAKQLGIEKNAVYRYLDEGAIPALRFGRKWLISESSLAAALNQRERAQTELRRIAAIKMEGAVSYDAFIGRAKEPPLAEDARRVIVQAKEEVMAANHSYLGQEHLLLALLRDENGTAAKMLNRLAIDVRSDIQAVIGKGDGLGDKELGLTPRAVKAIEFGLLEAREIRADQVGTDHLLIGIVRAGEGIGFELLTSRGATVERLRAVAKGLRRSRRATARGKKTRVTKGSRKN